MLLHSTAKVIFETEILDANTGITVKRNVPKPNLLLDSGLDGIAERSWWTSFSNCVLGTGTTPTKRDSGSVTVSISSETATASANFFEAGDVGRLLKLDSGQEVYITAYTSETVVSVAGATDDTASEFTVWYVNESGHQNEVNRTSTLSTDTGDNASTWDGTTIEHKRTFIFGVEGSARTYREIGWSHTGAAGNNLLGRALIPGGGDSISAGQQYKVTVRLQVTLSPVSQTAVASVGSGGWDTAGTTILCGLNGAFRGFSSGGIFAVGDGSEIFEPHQVKSIYLSTSDDALPSAPSENQITISGSPFGMTPDTYVAGSREKIYRITLATTQANNTWKEVGIGQGNPLKRRWALRFDTPQTKDSDHTLELVFRQTWGRSLIN
ncbi:hypothetical protein DDZ13_06605 [Coraliomargarita sinensis]|uniref:Uncharacterized protein n=1 Tax=Coraliomargarita sinensis TaxID=2174842 RepID=A0A317ZHA0_9BACT|nr:hypothetical protein [Coraliomargarita sinensis]PXA04830.1 hypothetical protein DDZ13_06605 [Coraliomargarita sinensis]